MGSDLGPKKKKSLGGGLLSELRDPPQDPHTPPPSCSACSPQLDHSRSVMNRLNPATFRSRMRNPITDRFWKFRFMSAKPRGHGGYEHAHPRSTQCPVTYDRVGARKVWREGWTIHPVAPPPIPYAGNSPFFLFLFFSAINYLLIPQVARMIDSTWIRLSVGIQQCLF